MTRTEGKYLQNYSAQKIILLKIQHSYKSIIIGQSIKSYLNDQICNSENRDMNGQKCKQRCSTTLLIRKM